MQIKLEKTQCPLETSDPHEAQEQTFDYFYEKNINWLDEDELDHIQILKCQFGKYFEGDSINYATLKEDILEPNGARAAKQAGELFKALFKLPFRTEYAVSTHDLELIEREFGPKVIAHGVEEEKGGMYNLLLMCISNQVRIPSIYWGIFVSGMPEFSPLSHGPYYLIYSMPSVRQSSFPPDNPQLSEVARILVPFSKNKDILLTHLDAMITVDLITPEAKKMFMDKLVTYKELLCELQAQPKPEKAPEASTAVHSFFNPLPTLTLAPTDSGQLDSIGLLKP